MITLNYAKKKENIIIKKTEDYSDRVIRLYQYLIDIKKEKTMSKQILRSGTSIGANVAESRFAQSRLDFISKLSIALKEANETSYWLNRIYNTNYINKVQYESMNADIESIIKILVRIIKTSKGTE